MRWIFGLVVVSVFPLWAEGKETCAEVHAMMRTVEKSRRKNGAAIDMVMADHPQASSRRSGLIAPLQRAQRAHDAKTRELSEKLRKMECPPLLGGAPEEK